MLVDPIAKTAPTSPDDILDFLLRFHAAEPASTERTVGSARTDDDRSSYEVLCDICGPLEGQHVLDLACGSGPLSELLVHRIGDRGKVTGVDLSEPDLEIARARVRRFINVEFRREPADRVSLPSGSVATVCCHLGFMLFNPIQPVVREVSRVLKSRGTFAAVVPTLDTPNALYTELVSILKDVLREEIPHFDHLQWGAPEARTTSGLQQLFTRQRGFDADLRITHFDLVMRDAPQIVAKKLLQFYYYNALLTEQAAARLISQWEGVLNRQRPSNGSVELRFPLSAFAVSRC